MCVLYCCVITKYMSVLFTIKNQNSAQNKYEPKSIDVSPACPNCLCIASLYVVCTIQFALNELVEQLWCCTMHVYGLSQILKEYSDMPHTHTHTHTWDNKVFICKTTILQGNCLKLCAQNIKTHVLATNMANIKKKDSNYRCGLITLH